MKHPFRIVISFVVVAFLGLAVIPQLSINLNPDYNLPALTLTYTLPNSSPEIVEQEATSILENAFSGLSNLNELKSTSNYNQGAVTLLFDRGVDIAYKKFEVISILRNIRQHLPPRMSYPVISQNTSNTKEAPLLVYSVNGAYSTIKIKEDIERHLVKELTSLIGIDKVDITGAVPLQIIIDIDPHKAQTYQLTEQHITTAINQVFNTQYLGFTRGSKGHQLFVKLTSESSLKALKALPLKSKNLTTLTLQNIASVYVDEQARYQYFRVNGLNSVSLRVYAKKGVNRIQLANTIKSTMASSTILLPTSLTVINEFDDTLFLQKELTKIYYRAGLSIAILTLFIFLMYRDIRHLTVLLLGIFITLCLTLLGAWAFKISIHIYTIAGITIAFGLIVDNAIIMLDHLNRHKNRKVFLALLAATGTTMAALSIIFFLPEEDRQNLTEFSAIITLSLVLSLGVALWFTPALHALLLTTKTKPIKKESSSNLSIWALKRYGNLLLILKKYQKIVILVLVLVFGLPIFLLPSKWENKGWYNSSIGSDTYQEKIRPITDKWLGGTLRLFVRNVFEKSGYRTNEQTRLYVNAHLSFGHTLAQMNTAILKVEEYLKDVEGIEKFVTSVYSGQDASIIITFKEPYEKGALPYQLKARLIARSLDWGGVEWDVYGVGRGFSNSSGNSLPNYRVAMKGYNYNELERQAHVLANKLLKHKRIQEVNTNEKLSWNEQSSTQIVIAFNLDKMGNGITPAIAANTLKQHSYHTNPSASIIMDDKQVPVVIKYANAKYFSTHNLTQNTFWVNDSLQLDYTNFSTMVKEQTMNAIHKENRQYIRVVGFDYYGSAKFGTKYLDKVLVEMENELPLGYNAKKLGWQWNWEKTKRNYGLLFILIIAIYFICSVLFENLKQPLYIIGVVPLSFVGLFLTFAVFDFYFDQGGYAAFILLGGLTVNAAIFIVYDLNNLKEGSYNQNVVKAVTGKAKPILLTIASTCFGLTPFLLEGQNEVFWFSLAAGTIGGLVCSLLVVFFVLPVWLMKKNN